LSQGGEYNFGEKKVKRNLERRKMEGAYNAGGRNTPDV